MPVSTHAIRLSAITHHCTAALLPTVNFLNSHRNVTADIAKNVQSRSKALYNCTITPIIISLFVSTISFIYLFTNPGVYPNVLPPSVDPTTHLPTSPGQPTFHSFFFCLVCSFFRPFVHPCILSFAAYLLSLIVFLSFIPAHSYIHSLVQSLVHSKIDLLVCLLVCLLSSSVICAFVRPSVCSVILHLFVYSFTHYFIRLPVHSSILCL